VHYNHSQVEARAVVDAIARADGDAFFVGDDLTERGEAKRVVTDAVEKLGCNRRRHLTRASFMFSSG
jgi:hypothetical protein